MFERILNRLRERIRAGRYVMTLHAEEEMDEDRLTIYDVEHGILTGTILERQKEKTTGEAKYRIKGRTVEDESIEILAKETPTDKLVIITVYRP